MFLEFYNSKYNYLLLRKVSSSLGIDLFIVNLIKSVSCEGCSNLKILKIT